MSIQSGLYEEYTTYHLPLRNDTLLNGIIKNSQEKGNPISVSSSTVASTPSGWAYRAEYVINYTRQDIYYWHSGENCNFGEFIELEFTNQWIRPSGYVFVDSGNVYKSRNWELRASSDGSNYVTLDSHSGVEVFTESFQAKYFKIRKKHRPFRYVRIVQTGRNYYGNADSCAFRLGKIELFGDSIVCSNTNQNCKGTIPSLWNECSPQRNHNNINNFVLFVFHFMCC